MKGVKGSGGESWKARADSICSVCPASIFKGDEVHLVQGRVAHVSCHATDSRQREFNGFSIDLADVNLAKYSRDYREDEPTFVVRGKRNHERKCTECFMVHAGKPGDDCP